MAGSTFWVLGPCIYIYITEFDTFTDGYVAGVGSFHVIILVSDWYFCVCVCDLGAYIVGKQKARPVLYSTNT